jgi:hypothetical protein
MGELGWTEPRGRPFNFLGAIFIGPNFQLFRSIFTHFSQGGYMLIFQKLTILETCANFSTLLLGRTIFTKPQLFTFSTFWPIFWLQESDRDNPCLYPPKTKKVEKVARTQYSK